MKGSNEPSYQPPHAQKIAPLTDIWLWKNQAIEGQRWTRLSVATTKELRGSSSRWRYRRRWWSRWRRPSAPPRPGSGSSSARWQVRLRRSACSTEIVVRMTITWWQHSWNYLTCLRWHSGFKMSLFAKFVSDIHIGASDSVTTVQCTENTWGSTSPLHCQ